MAHRKLHVGERHKVIAAQRKLLPRFRVRGVYHRGKHFRAGPLLNQWLLPQSWSVAVMSPTCF